MSINCSRVRPLLRAFLDGELAGAEHGAVREHLSACQRCGRVLSLLSGIKGLAAEVKPVSVPVGFADRVLARALAPAPRPWRLALVPALALAGVLVLLWHVHERRPAGLREEQQVFSAYERNIMVPSGPLLPPSGAKIYRCRWHYCGGDL